MVLFDGFKSIRSAYASAREKSKVECWVKRVFDELAHRYDVKSCEDNNLVPAKKFIHYIGAACKFTLSISNSPFTGVFNNGVQHGIMRMGSATWLDPFPLHGLVPGVSIKIFRSYR